MKVEEALRGILQQGTKGNRIPKQPDKSPILSPIKMVCYCAKVRGGSSSYGRTLDHVIAELKRWGLQHRKLILVNKEN